MFGRPLRLGKLFGIRLTVSWSLILLVAAMSLYLGLSTGNLLVGALVAAVSLSALFASVLAHELGHALVAQRLGVRIPEIELHFFGGAAKMASPPRSARDEVLISAAGPLVSFALAALFAVLTQLIPPSGLVTSLATVNLVLGSFNLLPALPMDGGRILRAILAHRSGYRQGTEQAVKVARVVALGLGFLALLSGNFFLVALSVFLWMLGTRELQMARMMAAGYDSLRNVGAAPYASEGQEGVEVYDQEGRLIGIAPGHAVSSVPGRTESSPRWPSESGHGETHHNAPRSPRAIYIRRGRDGITFVTNW